MIKLIATDMDGTLLNHRMDISPENRKTIQKLKEHGVKFAVATGRHLNEALPILNKYDIHCPLITANGGAIYDENRQLVKVHALNNQDVIHLVDTAKQFTDLHVEIMSVEHVLLDNFDIREREITHFIQTHHPHCTTEEFDTLFQEVKHTLPVKHVASLVDYVSKEQPTIIKLMIFTLNNSPQLQEFKKHIENLTSIVVSSSHQHNIEISSPEGQKGDAVAQLAQAYQIPLKQVMALGDNLNDFSMISRVGYGIAMGNAVEALKEVAYDITDTNTQNGFAKAIDKYVFSSKKTLQAQTKVPSTLTKPLYSINRLIRRFNKNVLKLSWVYIIAISLILLIIVQAYRSFTASKNPAQQNDSSVQQKLDSLEIRLEKQERYIQDIEKQLKVLKNKN